MNMLLSDEPPQSPDATSAEGRKTPVQQLIPKIGADEKSPIQQAIPKIGVDGKSPVQQVIPKIDADGKTPVHQLIVKIGPDGKKKQGRCAECYKIHGRKGKPDGEGRKYAAWVRTICIGCPGQPFFCTDCFSKKH